MLRILSYGFFLLFMSVSCNAATQQDINAANREAVILQQQEQQRQERERHQMEWELAPDGADLDAFLPKLQAKHAGRCREVLDVVLTGATVMSANDRREITAPYLDRCLDAADIEHLLADITAYYIHQGYVTARAYLAPQDLVKGQLEILIVEGSVSKILLEDGQKNHSVSLATAFPCLEGNILNLRDIEQGLDQINAVQSNNATMNIMPGEKPGESVVMIKNEPSTRLHANLSADNEGSQSIGTNQVAASVTVDRPLGLNDFINITHRQTHPTNWDIKMSRSDSVMYWLPLGYNTFSYNYSISKYVSTVLTPGNQTLRSNGDNESFSGKAERTVYRDQKRRLKFSGTLTIKDSHNYLADQYLEVSSRRLSIIEAGSSYMTHILGGAITLNAAYAQGLNGMDALRDPDDSASNAPKAQFGKITYGVNYNRPFMLGRFEGSLISNLSVQRALDPLYGSEQMLVGGIYTVRGFVNNSFSGDNGYYWTNDLSLNIPIKSFKIFRFKPKGNLRPYIALDHGQVSSLYDNTLGGTLTGGAVGLQVKLGIVDVEIFNSRPIDAPYFMSREHSHTYVTFKLSN